MLNLSDVNLNDFSIIEKELYGEKVFIIKPKIGKYNWRLDELHLRSLLCDEDGNVLSSGFPKFFNYGEVKSLNRITNQQIQNNNAWFTEKLDGSLLIRSVLNRKVHFRTRGYHIIGPGQEQAITSLVEEKYPKLLNPELEKDYSLLFEYTGPENKIILNYDDSKLTALGKMNLTVFPPRLVTSPDVVESIKNNFDTPSVRFYDLTGTPKDIRTLISSWKNTEGVVLWSQLDSGSMHLVKLKSEEYMRLHSLKYQMSDKKIERFIWYNKLQTFEEFSSKLSNLGLDWETITLVRSVFDSYIQRKKAIEERVQSFITVLDQNSVSALPTQKDKALKIKTLSEEDNLLFTIGIRYLSGKDIQSLIDSRTLDVSEKALGNIKPDNIFKD